MDTQAHTEAVVNPRSQTLLVLAGAVSLALYLGAVIPSLSALGGVDNDNFNHWIKVNFAFGGNAVDTSVLSPFQGMAGLPQPLAVRLHLPYLLAYLVDPCHMNPVVTVVCAFFMSVAIFVFAVALGARPITAVIAGQIAAVGLFPPLWVFLLPWTKFWTVDLFSFLPGFAFPVILGILFLSLFMFLGSGSSRTNLFVAVSMIFVFLYSSLVDPLYTAMFWIYIGWSCVGVLLSSPDRRQLMWRLGSATAAIVICLGLGVFHFYYALFKNAARSVFPNELYVEVQQWDRLTGMFSHGGGSLVASFLLVASCYYLITRGQGTVRGIAIATILYFVAMIGVSAAYVYSGIKWHLPLPVYLEVTAAPAYLVCIILAAQMWVQRNGGNWLVGSYCRKPWPHMVAATAVPLVAVLIYGAFVVVSPRLTAAPDLLVQKEPGGVVSRILVPMLSLQGDGRFRGSVATLAVIPGGEILRRAGVPEDAPFTKDFINFRGQYLRSFDPMLYMTGLWEMGVPTLEDNNHLVTPPFYYLYSRCLSRPQDFQSRNWTLCTQANPNLMAVLGAGVILADREMIDPRLTRIAEQRNTDGIPLLVYKITDPNLGDYSPTEILRLDSAPEIVAEMSKADFPFRNKAIVSPDESLPELIAAERGELFFDRGGFRVRATSKGWSLIVLPVQFSNSLEVTATTGSEADKLRLLRVNLLQTGLLFRGDIHVKIAHRFGIFRGVDGRLADIRDWTDLGIEEDGAINYPPNYQPLSLYK
jgi:hypothetical protein